jgi:hypothetical protein
VRDTSMEDILCANSFFFFFPFLIVYRVWCAVELQSSDGHGLKRRAAVHTIERK